LADHIESDLYSHFHDICDFIEQAREKNQEKETAVLVHCTGGVSSAPTAVLSYLMKKEKLPLDEAFASLKEKRPLIQPNLGFMQQLRKWQDVLQ
jgi:protein-tyrosine phosphatase